MKKALAGIMTLTTGLAGLGHPVMAQAKSVDPSQKSPQAVSCVSYPLQGDGVLGPYSGELQVWSNQRVFRKVNYHNPWKSTFTVQELWEGQLLTENIIRFSLKNHQFLSEVDNVKVSKEEFQKTEFSYLNLENLQAITNSPCQPWDDVENLRVKNPAIQGYKNPLILKLVKLIAINPIIRWFEKQPVLDPYRSNPDFKKKKFYTTDDTTDLKFYQENKNYLRLRNVTANEFTLTEAQLKNSAYAYSLDEKEKIMDEDTYSNNINSLGLFYHKIQGKSYPDGDSTLWSAMYLAAQAAKYQSTKDPVALEKVRKTLGGLLMLVEITNNPNEFARAALVNDGLAQVDQKWKLGTGKYKDIYWLPGGNNDMIKGLILGMAWGYKILPAKDPLRNQMIVAINKLKNLKLKRLNGLNQSYIYGLDSLLNNSPESYVKFIKYYLTNQNALEILGLNRQFFTDGIADWSGLNLATVANLSFYMIADEIEKKWPKLPMSLSNNDQIPDYSRDAQWVKRQQKRTIQLMNEVFKYVKRDFICLMNYSLNAELGPAPNRCFLSLLETPARIPEISLAFDNRLKEDFIIAPVPDLPWKMIGKKKTVEKHMVNNQIYPKFETDAFTSQMMWKEAFSLADRKPEGAHVPRFDFLFTYWTYKAFQQK